MLNSHIDKIAFQILALAIISTMALTACSPEPPEQNDTASIATVSDKAKPTLNISDNHAVILSETFWEKGTTEIQQLRNKAGELKEQIQLLLSNTNEAHLAAAQTAWRSAFMQYHRVAPYFSISHPSLNESLAQWPRALAAHPLQPGYLDSYSIYSHSGLVNDITLSISEDSLRKQHQLTDTEEVTLGLYAIEYILWGDKETRSVDLFREQTTVPLAFAQAGLQVKELPQNRRRELLAIQSELLITDLDRLLSQWQNGGLLHTLYHQLSPAQRLHAQNQGLQAALKEHVALLPTTTEKKAIELQANTFEKRYEALTRLAINEQTTQIEAHFFSGKRIGDEKQATTLAKSVFDSKEKERIEKTITRIKTNL